MIKPDIFVSLRIVHNALPCIGQMCCDDATIFNVSSNESDVSWCSVGFATRRLYFPDISGKSNVYIGEFFVFRCRRALFRNPSADIPSTISMAGSVSRSSSLWISIRADRQTQPQIPNHHYTLYSKIIILKYNCEFM